MWDTAIGDIVLEDGPRVALESFIAAKVDIAFENPKASKIYAMEITSKSGRKYVCWISRY